MTQPVPDDPGLRRTQARANDVAVHGLWAEPPPDVATMEQTIEVRRHPETRLRVYWPGSRRADPAAGLPVYVHYCGGGFTMTSIDWPSVDLRFRRMAAESGAIVVAGQYSWAPEEKFPTQPEQCWAVLDWAVTHADELGGDRRAVGVGGTTSGANLAAAVTLLNRDRARHPLRLQILEAPVLDLTLGHMRAEAASLVPRLRMPRSNHRLVRDYLGDKPAAARDPIASPLLADDLRGLPPALVITAELDPMSGDGEAYARALAAAGVPATCIRYLGQHQDATALAGQVPAADHIHTTIVAALRDLRAVRRYRAPHE